MSAWTQSLQELHARFSNKKVVFTNGCFDLLHPGHKYLLEFSRKHGDVLVVAVNSDASVKRLKGADRPVQALEERVHALEKSHLADVIIPFEEDTPLKIIEELKPAIYVKGADYEGKTWPEAVLVEKLGGKIVFAPLLEGYSTTALLQKQQNKK